MALSTTGEGLFQVLLGIHYTLAMLAAAVIGFGALRGSPFVPKAAVILAAYLGLPNLNTVGGLVGIVLLGGVPRQVMGQVMVSYGLMTLLGVLQLIAFAIGLRCLVNRAWPAQTTA